MHKTNICAIGNRVLNWIQAAVPVVKEEGGGSFAYETWVLQNMGFAWSKARYDGGAVTGSAIGQETS